MNPEEFAKRMRDLFPENNDYDPEGARGRADELLCQVLSSLGYSDGVQIFVSATKWYA